MSEASDNTQSGGLLRQQFLLDQVVAEIADRAPDEWERIDAVLMLLGSTFRMRFQIFTTDGPFDGVPNLTVPDAARELRDAMYVEGRGTWFSLSLTVWSSGEVSTVFNYDDRPPIRSSLAYAMRDDLEMYPRDVLPQWVVDELSQVDAREEDDHVRATRPTFDDGEEAEILPEAGEPVMDRETAREMARGFVPEEPGTSYMKITRAAGKAADPVMIFTEVDEDGYEWRKVEIFDNGLLDFAGPGFEGATTWLAREPLPSVEEMAQLPGVIAAELISPEEFQVEWLVATGPE